MLNLSPDSSLDKPKREDFSTYEAYWEVLQQWKRAPSLSHVNEKVEQDRSNRAMIQREQAKSDEREREEREHQETLHRIAKAQEKLVHAQLSALDQPSTPPQPATEIPTTQTMAATEKYPERAKTFLKLIRSIRPKIDPKHYVLARHGGPGHPDARTWKKILAGEWVREDSLIHAVDFLKSKGVKVERSDIPDC